MATSVHSSSPSSRARQPSRLDDSVSWGPRWGRSARTRLSCLLAHCVERTARRLDPGRPPLRRRSSRRWSTSASAREWGRATIVKALVIPSSAFRKGVTWAIESGLRRRQAEGRGAESREAADSARRGQAQGAPAREREVEGRHDGRRLGIRVNPGRQGQKREPVESDPLCKAVVVESHDQTRSGSSARMGLGSGLSSTWITCRRSSDAAMTSAL